MGALYYNVAPGLTIKAFWQNLFFLDTDSTPGFGSNGPLWSLNHEFWYYLGFPLLVFAVVRGSRWWVRLASIAAALSWSAFVGGYKLALYPVWLAGVLILFLPPFPARRASARRAAIAVSLGLLLAGFMLKSQGWLFPDDSITLGRSHWHPPIPDVVLSPFVVSAYLGHLALRNRAAARSLCMGGQESSCQLPTLCIWPICLPSFFSSHSCICPARYRLGSPSLSPLVYLRSFFSTHN